MLLHSTRVTAMPFHSVLACLNQSMSSQSLDILQSRIQLSSCQRGVSLWHRLPKPYITLELFVLILLHVATSVHSGNFAQRLFFTTPYEKNAEFLLHSDEVCHRLLVYCSTSKRKTTSTSDFYQTIVELDCVLR